jgi:HSP20 family protein
MQFAAERASLSLTLGVFDRNLPSLNVGAGVPTIDVAETTDAIEVSAELPGVDEKDIKVSLDGNRLVISGEKKEETKKDDKDWHVEERSYGSFYRSMSLPFKPEDGASRLTLTREFSTSTSRSPRKSLKAPRL